MGQSAEHTAFTFHSWSVIMCAYFRVPPRKSLLQLIAQKYPAARRTMERLVFARKFSFRIILVGAIVALLVVTSGIAMLLRAGRLPVAQAVPFSDLLRQLDGGAVSEVIVNGDALEFKLKSGESFRTVAPANYVTANSAFVPDLAKRNVRIDVRSASEQSAFSYGALILGVTFLGLLGV